MAFLQRNMPSLGYSGFALLLLCVALTLAGSIRDGSTENDHAAMLAFVSGVNESCRDSSWTSTTPVCSWIGVTCDASGRVVYFAWANMGCLGNPDLSLLPSALIAVDISANNFSGPVNITALPSTLTSLNLYDNAFYGPLDFSALPSNLSRLELGSNNFSGPLDLSRLPDSLEYFGCGGNSLSGSLSLSNIPQQLRSLDLQQNAFAGLPDFTKLPPQLYEVFLQGNRLKGNLNLSSLPPSLWELDLQGNPGLCGDTRINLGCVWKFDGLALPLQCICEAANNTAICGSCH